MEVAMAETLMRIYETMSEAEQKEFVRQFGAILRAQNLLSAFDQFNPETAEAREQVQILPEGMKQDYLSWYNQLHEDMSHDGKGKQQKQYKRLA